MGGFSFTEPYNRIYSDYTSAIPLKTVTTDTGTTQGGIDSVVFFVDDPSHIDRVKTDAKAVNIDWSKYTLDANDAAYKQMMGPIDNVASFSMMVVYIVAIAGALILALLLMLSVKERMYETGVLLSMGQGKLKIIDSLNISTSPEEIGKMSAAGLLILLGGTIFPATAVMRYRPKAILSKA